MEAELKIAYERTDSTINDTYRFCERHFPSNAFPIISIAMQNLMKCMSTYHNLVNSIAQKRYAATFADLCSDDSGRQGIQDLIDTLNDAAEFIARKGSQDDEGGTVMKVDLSLVHTEDPRLYRQLELSHVMIESHRLAVNNCASSVSSMFSVSATYVNTALVRKNSERDEDYKATLARLVTVFRQKPFAVARSWEQQSINNTFSLSVINDHHYTFLASSDFSHQPSFHGIEKEGRLWVDRELEKPENTKEIDRGRSIHHVARTFLGTIKETSTDAKRIQMSDPSWVRSFSAIRDCLGDVDGYLDKVRDLDNLPRRYAVCGKMSAGKSSVINAMIGAQLLPESARPCTGWPTIIKHDPSLDAPTLTVNPSHFQPFIDFLKDWYGWFDKEGRTPSQLDSGAAEFDKSVIIFRALTRELQARIQVFQDPTFKIREKSVSQLEIIQTTQDISDVIRLAYALAPTKRRPNPGNQQFPILSCNFQDVGRRVEGVEFVDLPGLGDANVDDMEIEEIYRIAMQDCHGTIMVIDASKNTIIADRSLVSAIKRINQVTKDNPLAVICTGVDKHDSTGVDNSTCWKSDDKMELCRMIFQTPELSIPRVLFCSPPLYRSARFLSIQLEKALQAGSKFDFDEMWQEGGELCMGKDFGGRFGARNWAGSSQQDFEESFEGGVKISKVGEIPQLLHETLELEVADKRYMDAMDEMRRYLKVLWRKQQVMLEHSNSNRQAMEAAKRRCSDFRQASFGLVSRWEVKGHVFLRNRLDELEDKLSSAGKKAEGVLELAIKTVSTSVKYRSTQCSAFEIGETIMHLADQAEAAKFLFDVDTEIKGQLDKLQDEIVISVRKAAHIAWEGRIRDLGAFFEAHQLSMPDIEALRDKLVSELEKKSQDDIAASLAELVSNLVTRQKQPNKLQKMMKNFQQSFKARHLARHEALELLESGKSSISKDDSKNDAKDSIAEKLTKVASSMNSFKPLTTAEAEELHTKGVNSLGYLIRAPVSGNVAECPINTIIWPFLKESKKSIKPVEFKLDMVLNNYRQYVLEGWLSIVANDSRTSLKGAIDTSSGIAKKTVLETLDAHLAMLNDAEKAMDRPMEASDEEKLLLLQTDFATAFTASDCLHGMLAAERSKGSKTVI